MPIPAFTPNGLLPEGVHDCTVEELRQQFGSFQVSDRRPRLFSQLEAFLAAARSSGLVRHVVVDGSFVTAETEPNDIDLIVIIQRDYDLGADLLPSQYNVASKNRVRKRFGFDLVAVRENSAELDDAVGFFEQVRGRPGLRKGILRLTL